jgi:hypothetical protein
MKLDHSMGLCEVKLDVKMFMNGELGSDCCAFYDSAFVFCLKASRRSVSEYGWAVRAAYLQDSRVWYVSQDGFRSPSCS